MARYTGPKCRRCRKEGIPLFLKGERCETIKCPITKKKGPPGPHKKFRKKPTEYSEQLRAKQQVKRTYGVMEKQFRRYFHNAAKHKGKTGLNLLLVLEMRLDNVVKKLGFASSLAAARQVVLHKHIKVNGKTVNIPSYEVKINDKIQITNSLKENLFVKKSMEISSQKGISPWLSLDMENLTGTVIRQPVREEMAIPYNEERPKEQLIVELYSK
ncbi:MAG: 30S ribosomal protein S4 [Elusimicrobia bacterium]|nr:30S ribosomal protein S4 [Elusimicrobiota bacterium]